nr:hypothetical protein [uncultured Kingella sp.]
MIRCWLALTYYLYALRLAALSHFYFNRLYYGAEEMAAEADRLRLMLGHKDEIIAQKDKELAALQEIIALLKARQD